MKARILLITCVGTILFFGSILHTYPQDKGYPHEPVQIVVANRPGGGMDLFFRLLAEELKNIWKVPVNVVNKFEGGGTIAGSLVSNSPKNGYTILGILTGSLASVTAARPKGVVDLFRDFDPLAVNIGYSSALMIARSDSELKSLKEVIDYARKKPGDLLCSSGQVGTPLFLDLVLLKRITKVDITNMSTSGTSEQITGLLGGHVQLIIVTDITARPHIRAGKFRGLVTDIKSPIFPDIPTFAESGYPQINLIQSIGILGPKGLPLEVIKAWENALDKILKEPKFAANLEKLGYNTNMVMGGKKLNAFFKEEYEKYLRFSPEELGWK